MSTHQITLSDSGAEQRTQQIRRDLDRLGWHDWSLWILALTVILAMTATLAAVLSSLADSDDRVFQLTMAQSIRGLLGLVLIFSAYTFYQQLRLKKTRTRLAKQVEIATQQQERAEQVLALATPDELTGLYDERFAQLRLVTEVARTQRNGNPLTILMLGMNHLGEINDRYGTATGNLAFKTLAESVNRTIRGCDLAVVAGQGEIMVILPECPVDQIPALIDRLPAMKIEGDGKTIPLSFAANSTSYKQNETPGEFSRRARQEFDIKKQAGINEPRCLA